MKFKFGDKVVISGDAVFYQGARGIVVSKNMYHSQSYDVLLAHGKTLAFHQNALIKVKRKGRSK